MTIPSPIKTDDVAVGDTPRETLWTMRNNNRRLTAEVRRIDGHWELRFFAQGVLFVWHVCATRASALAYADVIRADFACDRWHP